MEKFHMFKWMSEATFSKLTLVSKIIRFELLTKNKLFKGHAHYLLRHKKCLTSNFTGVLLLAFLEFHRFQHSYSNSTAGLWMFFIRGNQEFALKIQIITWCRFISINCQIFSITTCFRQIMVCVHSTIKNCN